MHPDYVSQHAAVGGAAAQVLASFFGTDDFSFRITTSTAPGGVFRSYASFSQAANENMNSRVWLGAHFRTACRHGLNQLYTGSGGARSAPRLIAKYSIVVVSCVVVRCRTTIRGLAAEDYEKLAALTGPMALFSAP